MGAIGEGKSKAEFDNKKIDKALKEKLSLKRNIVAMKYAEKAPQGITVEDGPQFWCATCGDIIEGTLDLGEMGQVSWSAVKPGFHGF